jgi:hypothetical protein
MNNEQKTVGGGASVGFGVLVVWLCGHFGLNMSAEVGTVIGGLLVAFGSVVAAEGIIGMIKHLFYGRGHK